MKKRVFGILAFVAFLVTLGTVGNIEQNQIALFPGTVIAFGSEALFALFLKLAGAFDPPPWEGEDEGGEEDW